VGYSRHVGGRDAVSSSYTPYYYAGASILALAATDEISGVFAAIDSSPKQVLHLGASTGLIVDLPSAVDDIAGMDITRSSYTISGRGTIELVDIYVLADGVLYGRTYQADGSTWDSSWTSVEVDADPIGLDANDAGVHWMSGSSVITVPPSLDVSLQTEQSLDPTHLPHNPTAFTTDGQFAAVAGSNGYFECVEWQNTFGSACDPSENTVSITCFCTDSEWTAEEYVLTAGELGRTDWNAEGGSHITALDGAQLDASTGVLVAASSTWARRFDLTSPI
jgi:hypothetical protein